MQRQQQGGSRRPSSGLPVSKRHHLQLRGVRGGLAWWPFWGRAEADYVAIDIYPPVSGGGAFAKRQASLLILRRHERRLVRPTDVAADLA